MTEKLSRKEMKRAQILTAATELFVEQGYATTSMDLIARKADVSKQTVYSHFGSKEELFSASIKQKCDSYHIIDFSLEAVKKPEVMLLQLAQRFLVMLTSKEALAVHKICAFESTSYPLLSELFYQAGPERITNEVSDLMQKMHDKKVLNIPNPRFAALQFLNIVKGEIWMQVEFNVKQRVSDEEVQRYLSQSVKHFIRGYQI